MLWGTLQSACFLPPELLALAFPCRLALALAFLWAFPAAFPLPLPFPWQFSAALSLALPLPLPLPRWDWMGGGTNFILDLNPKLHGSSEEKHIYPQCSSKPNALALG